MIATPARMLVAASAEWTSVAGNTASRATAKSALVAAKAIDRTVVIHVPADRYEGVPDYESWWDVPVAEVSDSDAVRKAREEHERGAARRRWYL